MSFASYLDDSAFHEFNCDKMNLNSGKCDPLSFEFLIVCLTIINVICNWAVDDFFDKFYWILSTNSQ